MKYFFSLLLILSCSISCGVLYDSFYEKIKFNDSTYKVKLLEEPVDRFIIKENDEIVEYRYILKDSSTIYFTKSNNGSDLLYEFLESKDFISLLNEIYFEKSFGKNNKSYLIVKNKGLIYGFSNLNNNKVNDYKNLFSTTLVKIK